MNTTLQSIKEEFSEHSLTWSQTIKIFCMGLLVKTAGIMALLITALYFSSGLIFALLLLVLIIYLLVIFLYILSIKNFFILSLKDVGSDYSNNSSYMLFAVSKDGDFLRFASDELKNDAFLVRKATFSDIHAVMYAGDTLKADRAFILGILERDGNALEYVLDDLTDDKEFVLTAVKTCPEAMRCATEALQVDRQFVIEAIRINSEVSSFLHEDLKDNVEVVARVVESEG